MTEPSTTVAGIVIPSTDPIFLTVVVGLHIPVGLLCVIAGAGAMLCEKGRGRHSTFGTVYVWGLAALFASATLLSAMRWSENRHLFVLGLTSFAFAWAGRSAARRRWGHWIRLHILGMSMSYVVMLIAFYVDNGKQLPIWRDLPSFAYWLLPLVVAAPLVVRALFWHPLLRRSQHA
jgi:uncharacterized membrane protein